MSDRITDRLDAITARASAATEGPWEAHTDLFQDESHRDVEGSWIPGVAEKDFHDGDKPALSMLDAEDAEFIAAARTDVPALVTALRAVLELHEPEKFLDFEVTCSGCDIGTLDPPMWPCDTVRAITTALGDDR